MTMKRSPKSKTPTRFQKARFTRPFPDHYWAAQPPRASEEHPLDVLIGDLPEIASRHRKLGRMDATKQAEARAWAQVEHGPGRPPTFQIPQAQSSQDKALQTLDATRVRQERAHRVIRGIGTAYHPVDLKTGPRAPVRKSRRSWSSTSARSRQ
jgi:hypothetical protein